MSTVSKFLSCVHVPLSNFTVCRGRRSCSTTAENFTKKHNTLHKALFCQSKRSRSRRRRRRHCLSSLVANDIFNQKISHSVPGIGLGRGLGRGLTRGLGLGLFIRPLPLKRKTYHAEVIY